MNNNSCCISDILKAICILQYSAERMDDIENTCDRPFLGINAQQNTFVYNTRPITLYTANNNLISTTYETEGETNESNIFRIEKIEENLATLRVLAPNPDETSIFPYIKTDSFIIVNTGCVCALRCLNDTFIDCI